MSSLWKRILLQVVVLATCAWFIWPPSEKIRLGRDLAGGVSLVYSVEFADNENPDVVFPQLIAALKDRLDPNGVLEIAINSVGRTQLEIQMPLARQEVKDLRADFEAALTTLGNFRPTADTLRHAFELPKDQQAARFREIAGGRAALVDKLTEASSLFAARAALDQQIAALDASADPAVRDGLIAQRAEINPKYRTAIEALETSVVSPELLRKVLQLPNSKRMIRSDDGKTFTPDLSQQEVRLEQVRKRFPLRVEEIDAVVAKFKTYAAQRKTLDDPQDLVRLLRGSGALTFRIPVAFGTHPEEAALRAELQEKGPNAARRPDARWCKINQIANWYESVGSRDALLANTPAYFAGRKLVGEAYVDGYYILCWDTALAKLTTDAGDWKVARADESRDEFGKPAISFTMDNRGAVLLGELTARHVGQPMAVLLDDEIYTAPTLNSAISRSGIITNVDAEDERKYIIKVLNAGALQAKLSPEPISTNTQSPQLGADNLRYGLQAGLIALVTIGVFMIVYYFTSGVIAVVALLANALVIIGLMAWNHAAYTMPGIAGMILTFGMAVDANVLIYERIREELRGGADLKEAVRLGFSRALASILDGNITNLIVCVALGLFGSAEVRGFAITMSIGVLGTLYAGLILSKLIFDCGIAAGWRKTSMLPMAVPGLQTFLTPHFNWLKYRWIFFAISIAYVTFGMIMMFTRGSEMLDTEFRGGTQVALVLKPTAPGSEKRVTLTRKEIITRIEDIAEPLDKSNPLKKIESADVIAINPEADGVTSSHFKIKTIVTDSKAVLDAISTKFQDVLETEPPLTFKLAPDGKPPAFPIETTDLATVIGRTLQSPVNVREYRGGVAIVLDSIAPPQSLANLRERLERTRQSASYNDTFGRQREIIILKGEDSHVESAALLINDPNFPYSASATQAWHNAISDRERQLALDALAEASTPASVNNFSPTIAATFRLQAIFAVTMSFALIAVYIWIRFNSARYAFAAIIALLHDVLTVLGMMALCQILFEHESTAKIARQLGLLPFKIDLNLVAAVLTVAGYSLNDTIIIMDRIREHRGKARDASEHMVNSAINQTISRTLITSGTTFTSSAILYLFGGEGVRSFAFALMVGIGVGTYSSVAVAAPIVWVRKKGSEPETALTHAPS